MFIKKKIIFIKKNWITLILICIFFTYGVVSHRFQIFPINYLNIIKLKIELKKNALLRTGSYVAKKIDKSISGNKINVKEIELSKNVKLYYSPSLNIDIDWNAKKIDIEKKLFDEFVVIAGTSKKQALFENWEIKMFADPNSGIQSKMFSLVEETGINSCLTLVNLELARIKIYSENLNCEDSVNIVFSIGQLDRVEIFNSISDGLDADDSNIRVNKAVIFKAGMDCVDLGKGSYYIGELTTYECKNPLSIDFDTNIILEKLTNYRKNQWNIDSEKFISDPFDCSKRNENNGLCLVK